MTTGSAGYRFTYTPGPHRRCKTMARRSMRARASNTHGRARGFAQRDGPAPFVTAGTSGAFHAAASASRRWFRTAVRTVVRKSGAFFRHHPCRSATKFRRRKYALVFSTVYAMTLQDGSHHIGKNRHAILFRQLCTSSRPTRTRAGGKRTVAMVPLPGVLSMCSVVP